ncbi:MAG TPA: post-transcriptional regulator [Pseudogracilibacillus sp.]|nr:post-transcriptional regulator [Pseudogracilibacillus sp.]
MNKAQVVEIKHRLMPILKSKENEYKTMGYKDISTEDIWDCLWNQIWKSKQEFTLHQIVQDILHLPIQTYMSYLSLSAYHRDNNDLMKSIQAVTNNEIK